MNRPLFRKFDGLQIPVPDLANAYGCRAAMETDLLVDSADDAAVAFAAAGGRVVVPPFAIPIGRCTVVHDPWAMRWWCWTEVLA